MAQNNDGDSPHGGELRVAERRRAIIEKMRNAPRSSYSQTMTAREVESTIETDLVRSRILDDMEAIAKKEEDFDIVERGGATHLVRYAPSIEEQRTQNRTSESRYSIEGLHDAVWLFEYKTRDGLIGKTLQFASLGIIGMFIWPVGALISPHPLILEFITLGVFVICSYIFIKLCNLAEPQIPKHDPIEEN